MTFGHYADLASQDVWPDAVLDGARARTAFARRPLARSLEPERLAALLEQPVRAVEQAEAAPGRHPLIVVGQGLYYESPITHAALCEYLASHGFVVATAPLVGSHSPLVRLDVLDLETQVRDLEFVVARVRELPFVDGRKLGLLGFDMGGMACLILAMRNPDVDAFGSIDAGILFSLREAIPSDIPAASPHHDASRLRAPWLHATQRPFGTPPAGYEGDYLFDTALHSERYLVLVDEVSHVDFTSYALIEDRKPMPGYWGPPRAGASARYEAVCLYLLRFFTAYLAGDPEARAFLARDPEDVVPEADLSVEHRAAAAARPTFSDLLNALLVGKIDEALATARDLAEVRPDDPSLQPAVLDRLGSHLLASWELAEQGFAILKLNVELHPESPEAWASLGEGHLWVGDDDRAMIHFRKSLELDPENEGVRRVLEWLEGKQDSSP
jgi:pimeloyl-ACP methyl ester carboxylesterase